MLIPKFLKQGDLIGVPAPSDGSNCFEKEKRFLNAKKRLEDLGYQVKLSDNIFNSIRGRSSSAIKRANEINDMFKDKNIKIMLCAAGGDQDHHTERTHRLWPRLRGRASRRSIRFQIIADDAHIHAPLHRKIVVHDESQVGFAAAKVQDGQAFPL